VDNSEVINVLSLCTGYAGLEIGLAQALQRPLRIVAVEIEAFAAANLVAKAEAGKLAVEAVWPDVRTFGAKKFRDCFDIITAGYPCQPFSVGGKRKGEADPRHLWPHIERIVKAVRPVYGFFENVAGHLTLGYPTVYRGLRNMGYSVEAGLFTAAEVGAPHKRQRLFILAHRQCAGEGLRIIKETPPGIGRDRFAIGRWPARPGHEQYEWEEPRVLADARKQKSTGLSGGERQTISEARKVGQGQTQSRLGGTVDGTACRVDRLRLLGNGVVPQCAAKAWCCLMDRIR